MTNPGGNHGIENLFCVEQDINLWRGGDPTPEGWQWLYNEGIRYVVKLNTEAEGTDCVAASLGMTIHRFPIPWWRQVIFRPRQKDLVAAVSCLIPKTYVHCEHGEDRTGLIVGCFRLSQGWSKSQAYAEMLAFGFHPELQGLLGRWNTQDADDWYHPTP